MHRGARFAAAFVALVLLCLCFFHARALAQPTGPRTLTAGVLTDWPPYYLRGTDGRPAGFAIDVFEAVAARADMVPKYRTYPSFGAMQDALRSGEIDVIPNMGVLPERHFLFSTPISTFDISVFVRRSSPELATHVDLHGKVAVVASNVGERLVNDLPGTETVVYGDVREALFRLLSGDVDALIFASPVVWALARGAHVDHQIRELPPGLLEVKRGMAVALGRGDLLARINRALESFVGSPEYVAIYRRWHAPPEPYWTARRVAVYALIALVLVGLAGAIWRYATVRKAHRRIRFQARLLDVIGESVIATDREGRVIYWNRFAEQLYGWTAEEAHGRVIAELTTPQESSSEAAAIMAQVRDGKRWQGEFPAVHRDGKVFPALVTIEPIFDDASAVAGIVGVSTDLTTLKQLEEQLRQAQKMESIGRLAGGVAHDFNNLLTVIAGTTEIVMDDMATDDPHRADLQEVRRASDRAAALTQQLLALSRKQISQPQVMDLNTVVREAQRMLGRVIGEDIALTVRPGDDLGHVRIDPTQIQQVILNLAVNSRDAMPEGGRLTISTANVELEADSGEAPWIAPGAYVVLEVSDTGVGMDEATCQHVFEPFFTTKGPGRGTGLGLSTVYGIVQQSGGSIRLHSTPGAGTTFEVYFPRVCEPLGEAELPPATTSASGTETILVVEDEPGVRQLVVRTLETAGYKVLLAHRADEALFMAGRYAGRIDLLLTDVVLPDMYGPELAKTMTRNRPDTRVLYMSGYAESTIVHHGVVDAGAQLISKPFTLDMLVRTVRQVLDAGVVGAGRV